MVGRLCFLAILYCFGNAIQFKSAAFMRSIFAYKISYLDQWIRKCKHESPIKIILVERLYLCVLQWTSFYIWNIFDCSSIITASYSENGNEKWSADHRNNNNNNNTHRHTVFLSRVYLKSLSFLFDRLTEYRPPVKQANVGGFRRVYNYHYW